MADPTKEQFDAAAQKVMASAPPGLSRDQFFAAIDAELAKSPLQRANETPLKEPITYDAGFNKSLGDTVAKTGKGIVEGLNPMNTLRGFASAAKNTRKATDDFLAGNRNPPITTDNLKSLSDPETGGKAIGGLTQGLLLSAGSRLPLRSIASGTLDTVGKALDSDTAGLVEPRLPPAGRKMQGLAKIIGKTPGKLPIDPYMPNVSADTGGDFGPSASEIPHPQSLADRFMPNQSSMGDGEFGPSAGDIPHPESVVDRFMPNTSDAKPGMAVSHDHIPYGGATPPRQVGITTGQVVGKAPTLEEALIRALDEVRSSGEPPANSTLPADTGAGGEATLKQSGRFGKSGSLGQPGGFTSGRPPISPTRMDEILQKLGGRGESESVGGDSPPSTDAGTPPAAETTPGKPKLTTAEALQGLRRQVGSRDAAKMFYGSGSKGNIGLVKAYAPGASQLPLEAEQRIMDELVRKMSEGE